MKPLERRRRLKSGCAFLFARRCSNGMSGYSVSLLASSVKLVLGDVAVVAVVVVGLLRVAGGVEMEESC